MVRAVALAFVIALTACGHAPTPPPREFLGERVPATCAHDESSEACIEWWLDHLVVTLFGFRRYEDPAIERYVTEVGTRLVRATGDRHRWRFRVLDDPSVQAFVFTGRTVYLHRGTLAILRSEAELAAVLAHELGHLRGGHGREQFEELGRDLPRTEIEKSMQHQYARDDEIQADEAAVILMRRAGYDPRAVESMLRALAGTTRYDAEEDPASVHPWWPERIARVQAIASAGGELGEARYQARTASLIVGPDPRLVALVGTTVVFGSARAALELPPIAGGTVGDGAVDVVLAGGGKARISIVHAELAKLMAAMASDAKRPLEVHHEVGRDAITISVTGSPDDAGVAHGLREAIRAARPAELARLIPTRVDLRAPRRLWSR